MRLFRLDKDGYRHLSEVRAVDPGCGYAVLPCTTCGPELWRHPIGERYRLCLEVRRGGELDDFPMTAPADVVTYKVVEAIRRAGLTGVDFIEPEFIRAGNHRKAVAELVRRCRDFYRPHGLLITGRGGSIVESSGLRLKSVCPACRRQRWTQPGRGLRIDPAQWDGSDFFRVEEYSPIIITERAADVLNAAGLSNFKATPAESIRTHFD